MYQVFRDSVARALCSAPVQTKDVLGLVAGVSEEVLVAGPCCFDQCMNVLARNLEPVDRSGNLAGGCEIRPPLDLVTPTARFSSATPLPTSIAPADQERRREVEPTPASSGHPCPVQLPWLPLVWPGPSLGLWPLVLLWAALLWLAAPVIASFTMFDSLGAPWAAIDGWRWFSPRAPTLAPGTGSS